MPCGCKPQSQDRIRAAAAAVGDCYLAGKRRRAVSRDEARRLLVAGLEAGTHCEPDTRLHILGLARLRSTGPSRPAFKIEQLCQSGRILRPR
ncbi:DUF6233 domain-containing protein [Streptomyces sp. PAN_FS17]|uniref:DUF6233 domain-containing protein n=1 Tax=Streptomyces sp. PAN_FS17 TaxID=1855351 RepID=UPI00210ADE7C|nr:DUF6233 domain-containing protein [Streptomyces sp. PAN_FS17]